MKKLITLLFTLSMLLWESCSKMQDVRALGQTDAEDIQKEDIQSITFRAPAPFDVEGATRAMLVNDGKEFVWEATDTVGIYPEKGSQVYFSMEDGAGSSTSVFDGGGWALKSSSTYYSYYPFMGNMYLDKEKMPVCFDGQYQTGTDNFDNIRDYLFMCAKGTVSGNSLSFSYDHLCSFIYVKLSAPPGQYDMLTLSLDESLFVTDGYYALNAEQPAIVGMRFSDRMTVELKDFNIASAGKQYTVNFLAAPVDLTGKDITVTLLSADGKKYIYHKKPSRAYQAGTRYGLSCTSYEVVEQVERPDDLQAFINGGSRCMEVGTVPSEDLNLNLGGADGDISIGFPTEEADVKLKMSYSDESSSYPEKIRVRAPLLSSLVIDTPKSTVTVEGADIKSISARTAKSTLIVKSGVKAEAVYVRKGNIINNGTIGQLDFSSLEEDVTLLNYGTILSMTGIDNMMTTARGFRVSLFEAAGSSIGESMDNVKIAISGEIGNLNTGNIYVVSVYSSDNSRQWLKYAHGVFSDPEKIKVKFNPDTQYKIDMKIVENGVDSLYHFNALHNGGVDYPMYYKLGRLNNSFTYHDSDTAEDDFYGSEDDGTTWFTSNSSARNSRLKIYRGSVICTSNIVCKGVDIPVYYARVGVKIFVNGLEYPESKVQCTLTMASTFSASMDKDNSYFGIERSMSDLAKMMYSINSGSNGYETATLSVKYMCNFDGIKEERYLIRDQKYSLPRNQNTIFTITVNDNPNNRGNSGFLITMDLGTMSEGDNFIFEGTIRE